MAERREYNYKVEEHLYDENGKRIWQVRRVLYGIGLVFLMHLVLLLIPAALFIVGIIQLIYVLPAWAILRKDPGMVHGIWIGAGLTLLLNIVGFVILLNR